MIVVGIFRVSLLAISLLGSNSLFALDLAGAASAASDSGHQVGKRRSCLVRDANRRNRAGDSPQIPSTDRDQAELQARGYRTAPCRMTTADMLKFREQVCKVANLHDRVIEARFEELYGVEPAVMCRSAAMYLAAPEDKNIGARQ